MMKKIIALKARKVGGTSFEIALSRYANETSIITPITESDEKTRQKLGYRGPQNFKYPLRQLTRVGKGELFDSVIKGKFPMKFWNHMPAAEVRGRLGEDVWRSYTKVSIIRNPFDYMVSSYFWAVSENRREELSFENFCLARPDLLLWNKRIYEIDGKNIIDLMVRYDHLHDDISALERRRSSLQGLASTFLKLNAKGNYRPKSARTTEMFIQAPRSHALISSVCHDDIVRYGFEVPQISG